MNQLSGAGSRKWLRVLLYRYKRKDTVMTFVIIIVAICAAAFYATRKKK